MEEWKDRETKRMADRQADGLCDKKTDGLMGRQAGRQANAYIEIDTWADIDV